MTSYEELLELADLLGLRVAERYHFEEAPKLKGLIVNDKIKLSTILENDTERRCKLAEEIAHALLNMGNITDLRDLANARQEKKAHKLAVQLTVTLTDIADAVLYYGEDASFYNVAEHLGITVEFLEETIEIYKRTYGEKVDLGSCTVSFVPTFRVNEKYK